MLFTKEHYCPATSLTYLFSTVLPLSAHALTLRCPGRAAAHSSSTLGISGRRARSACPSPASCCLQTDLSTACHSSIAECPDHSYYCYSIVLRMCGRLATRTSLCLLCYYSQIGHSRRSCLRMTRCPCHFSCRFRSTPQIWSRLAMSRFRSRSTIRSANRLRKQLHLRGYTGLCRGLHLPSTRQRRHRHLVKPSYRSHTSHRSPTDPRTKTRRAIRVDPSPDVSFPRYLQCTLGHHSAVSEISMKRLLSPRTRHSHFQS